MAIQGARELAGELADIRKGKPGSIYLIYGSEGYLVRTSAEAVASSLAELSGAERTTVDATGLPAAAVLQPITSLSLFASSSVVLVRNFAHLLVGDEADRLLAGLDSGIGEGSAIVFAATGATPADKIDKRVKGYKGLVKRGATVELNTQKPDDLVLWLKEKARRDGKALDGDAAHLLVQRVGQNMEVLRSELDKAVLYHWNEERITAAGLTDLIGKSKEDAVWDVTEKISSGDVNAALEMLADLFAAGTYPLIILTLLVRQTRHLLQARLLWEQAGSPPFRDIRSFQSRVAGHYEKGAFGGGGDDVTTIHPFASFKRFEAARGHQVDDLRELLSKLRRADLDAKTGAAAGAKEVVEELVLDLCASGRSAA